MPLLEERIRELIQFYVKSNYESHLKENSIDLIPKQEIRPLVSKLYTERRDHLKEFVKVSLKKLLQNDYPGDLVVLNILVSVFEDDVLCINRVIMEIELHQQTKASKQVNYHHLGK
jgi:hypothetical protein